MNSGLAALELTEPLAGDPGIERDLILGQVKRPAPVSHRLPEILGGQHQGRTTDP